MTICLFFFSFVCVCVRLEICGRTVGNFVDWWNIFVWIWFFCTCNLLYGLVAPSFWSSKVFTRNQMWRYEHVWKSANHQKSEQAIFFVFQRSKWVWLRLTKEFKKSRTTLNKLWYKGKDLTRQISKFKQLSTVGKENSNPKGKANNKHASPYVRNSKLETLEINKGRKIKQWFNWLLVGLRN